MKKNRIVSLPSLREAAKRSLSEPVSYQKADCKPSSFLTNWGNGKIFCIRTYGCQANVRDSEIIRGYLLSMGMKESDYFEDADFILFNTCAVRENAENHLYGELGQAKKRYDADHDVVIAVCGCVMQEEVPVRYILDHFPFVSFIFGTLNIQAFYGMLEDSLRSQELIVNVAANSNKVVEDVTAIDIARSSRCSAFVNIMYGCNKFCTHCIVPCNRGKERSRRKEDILAEVRCLKEEGYQQVTLLGQNVDAYGKDFGEPYAFADLLEAVAETGIPRVRFVTPYPSDFNTKVFDVMARHPNIMPFMHMPLQSGSDHVRRAMNRRYTRAQYLNIIHELRQRIPDIFLSTDIIVGFPNETDEDFEETLSLVREARFDAAYTFIYSPRPGTPAAGMANVATEEQIHKRFDRLKALIDELTEERARTFVGQVLPVLFEEVSKKDDSRISGYDPHGKLVHVKGSKDLIGKIRNVRILESHTYSLIGELADD